MAFLIFVIIMYLFILNFSLGLIVIDNLWLSILTVTFFYSFVIREVNKKVKAIKFLIMTFSVIGIVYIWVINRKEIIGFLKDMVLKN